MSTLPNALVLGAVMSRSFEPARLADLKLLFRAYCRVERVGELARLGEAVALLKAPEAAARGASPEAVALLARAPRRAVIWPCPDEALIAYGDGERHTHYDGGTGAMSAVASPHERRAEQRGVLLAQGEGRVRARQGDRRAREGPAGRDLPEADRRVMWGVGRAEASRASLCRAGA